MAVREFNGTSDYCRLSIGGLGSMTYGTFAVLVKVTSSGTVKTPICLLSSAQAYVLTPLQSTATPEALEFDGIQLIASLPTGVWLLLVVRKATGTAAPRISYYNYTTTTWTHANAGTTHANWTAPTSGFVNTGTAGDASSEPFQGRLAVSAAWANSLPWSADSTGDTALVAAGLHTALSNWVAAAPSALWPWNPAVATGITDSIGTANQVAISGTTLVNGDDPAGFSFTLGPSVDAGADATVTVSTTFSRTATETSLTSVTARSWTVVSGPAESGSTIGTAAALSWTPTTTGSYVLRYSATHSTGTATDDVTVAVVNPTPTPVADRGSVADATAATTSSVTLTSPTAIATGNYLVARVAVDNSGASGAAPGCTVTDPRSNTWTVLGPALADPGAASAGATGYITYAKVATAYQAADALTFNWGGISTTAKAVVVEEWTYIHATSPIAVAAVTNNSGTAGSTTAVSVAITPTAADQAIYTCLATEGIAGDSITYDSDTTDGTWSTLTRIASANATATNNQCVAGQYKQVSGTTAQTWNATITSRDWAALAVVFAPTPPPTVTSAVLWPRRRGPLYRR